jgi:hypothetical protein
MFPRFSVSSRLDGQVLAVEHSPTKIEAPRALGEVLGNAS